MVRWRKNTSGKNRISQHIREMLSDKIKNYSENKLKNFYLTEVTKKKYSAHTASFVEEM